MYSTQLKIKRLALAAEARIIRHEEHKALGWLPILRDADGRPTSKRRFRKARFRPKLELFNSLHNHRTDKVRKASRVMHLAHGYLMGQVYASIENEQTKLRPNQGEHPLLKDIVDEIRKFGPGQFSKMDKLDLARAVDDWIEGKAAPIKIPVDGGAAAEAGTLNPDLAGSTPVAASS